MPGEPSELQKTGNSNSLKLVKWWQKLTTVDKFSQACNTFNTSTHFCAWFFLVSGYIWIKWELWSGLLGSQYFKQRCMQQENWIQLASYCQACRQIRLDWSSNILLRKSTIKTLDNFQNRSAGCFMKSMSCTRMSKAVKNDLIQQESWAGGGQNKS